MVRLADGTSQATCKLACNFHFTKCSDQREFCENLLVFPIESYDIILGIPWLRRHNPTIDWSRYEITFPKFDAITQIVKNTHIHNYIQQQQQQQQQPVEEEGSTKVKRKLFRMVMAEDKKTAFSVPIVVQATVNCYRRIVITEHNVVIMYRSYSH